MTSPSRPTKIRRVILYVFFFLFSFSFLFLIHKVVENSHLPNLSFNGRIDENLEREFFEAEIDEGEFITFTSSGGRAMSALKIATEIFDKKINVRVLKQCSSSCAEYILPAANILTFIDLPLVGFHGNPIMTQAISNQHFPKEATKCIFSEAGLLNDFYDRMGYDHQTWKIQLDHLSLKDPVFKIDDNGCHVFWNKTYENEVWYPNSEQLRDVFYLNFEGHVCADTETCYKRKLSRNHKRGTQVMVGDTVYIVQ